jgi:hypothetical protein
MARYVTVEELQYWARDKIPTANTEAWETALAAAEQALDNSIGRRIALAGVTATPRVFVPLDETIVLIDDAAEITAISNRGVPVTFGTQLEPLNGLSDAGEQSPYHTIRLVSGQWYVNAHEATVTVTARWGWPIIPPQAIEACKIAAKAIVDGRSVRLGLADLTPGGAVSEREARVVREFVHDYAGHRSIGIC